jgi:hypothetical protein
MAGCRPRLQKIFFIATSEEAKSHSSLLFLPFFYLLPDFHLSDFFIDAALTTVAGLEGVGGLLA